MFLDNKYSKIYFDLIAKRKLLLPDGYTENHNIIPVSLGVSNANDNQVRLTAREHFIAHLLLIKMVSGKNRYKMANAVMFFKGNQNKKDHYMNARLYESAKKLVSESRRGKKLSPAHLEKLRIANAGTKHPPRSEEWKSKQRLSHLGKKDSPETTLKKIAAHTGANNPRAKLWTLETNTGQVITISALKTWCREQNISFNRLCNTRKSNEFYSGLKVI